MEGHRDGRGDAAPRTATNAARWRQSIEQQRDLAAWFAANEWSQAVVSNITEFIEAWWRGADAKLAQLAALAQGRSLSAMERDRWVRAAVRRTVARAATELMWAASGGVTPRDQAARRAVCEAYVLAWELGVLLNGAIMECSPDPTQRDRATVSLSSWLATRVHQETSPALKRALTEDGSLFWPAFYERFPSAVVQAWSDLRNEGRTLTPTSLLNRATYILRRDGSRGNDSEPLSGSEPDEKFSGFEQQALSRVELEDLLARAKAAPRGVGLSKQQQDVVELKYQGLSHAEVAGLLGTTEDSVKTQWERARKKLRRLAG